jgi:DNA-binding LacI/PurR family transcriptional regulator
MKPLPFSVDRDAAVPLAAQVVHGVVSAIRSGYYAPGERLPPLESMAAALGVGLQTVRGALRELVKRGEVVARRKAGIRVAPATHRLYTRHILHLAFGGPTYYFAAKEQELYRRLSEANVRVTRVHINPQEFADGLPNLRTALDCHALDLAVVDGVPEQALVAQLVQRDLPFLCTAMTGSHPQARASLNYDRATAQSAMAAHCATCGIRTAWVVPPLGRRLPLAAETALRQAGITCVQVPLPPPAAADGQHVPLEAAGLAAVTALLARREPLPDMLYCDDDYLGRGVLMGLLAAGRRVPEDVQFVTHSNRGFVAVYPVPLTRIEFDPVADAAAMAELIVAALDRPQAALAGATLAARFIPGGTTRPRR